MILPNTSFHLCTLAIVIANIVFLSTASAEVGVAGADGDNVTYGGISNGTAGTDGDGGDGTDITSTNVLNSDINIQTSTAGGDGGDGGGGFEGGGGGDGGQGGGVVFGGFSAGGAGGSAVSGGGGRASANGGDGGGVSGNTVTLTDVTLIGAAGGNGGNGSVGDSGFGGGNGGDGGQGSGFIFGGFSSGGAGGSATSSGEVSSASANGGNGGKVFGNTVTLTNFTLMGAAGGSGGSGSDGEFGFGGKGGDGGQGGGVLFGGFSSGGAGGSAVISGNGSSASANGGSGGEVSGNTVTLINFTLMGAAGGSGGSGGGDFVFNGDDGQVGGSVFGGFSSGGAGGDAVTSGVGSSSTANGGDAGGVSANEVTISGTSSVSGSVYGGFSQGGKAGTAGTMGQGGNVINNTVTLEGANLTIAGSVYGGYSVDGNGTVNNTKAFTGNTLNLNGYRGSMTGIYNFEKYNWVLPKDVVNNDTLIAITGSDNVQLTGTAHTVAMENDGNRLEAGDTVTLIDKANGSPTLTTTQVKQGHFIIYDASLSVVNNEKLVLSIDGQTDTTPPPPSTPTPTPAGRLNPTSKAFLEGRSASLAFTNQGADLISDNGISAARSSLQQASRNGSGVNLAPFTALSGGSSRYETGSHVDARGFSIVLGVATSFELKDQSAITQGVFLEHGNGTYDTYNSFTGYASVRGGGDFSYTGGGVLFHMDVAGTGRNKTPTSNSGAQDGLYIDASLRTGNAEMRFDSNDLTDAEGIRGQYNSKSKYYSALAGVGYVLNVDENHTLDVYGRYTWGKEEADKVSIGNDQLTFGASQSSRVRVGTRYSYANTLRIKPYVGVAYEHEFKGDVAGSAYDMSIEEPSLAGNTGIVEAGVRMNPLAAVKSLSIDMGVQGYLGDREGATGSLNVSYAF